MRTMRTHVRVIATILCVFSLLSTSVARPSVGFAKEFEIDGTVDCGTRSGRDCPPLGDTLYVYTDDVTGELARIAVDISWIRNQLPGLDQDDRIVLLVEDRPGGGLQAVGVVNSEGLSGTKNPGASTGSKEVAEQPKPKQEDDDKFVASPPEGEVAPPTCFGRPATIVGAGRHHRDRRRRRDHRLERDRHHPGRGRERLRSAPWGAIDLVNGAPGNDHIDGGDDEDSVRRPGQRRDPRAGRRHHHRG